MAQVDFVQLYQDLVRCHQNEDYGKGLSICEKLIAADPANTKAWHCKIVCEVFSGLFEDALNDIDKNPSLAETLLYEKAYCEYRLSRIEECVSTLKQDKSGQERVNELMAQALYRMEKYQESHDLYLKIMKNTDDEYEDEREANLSAVMASISLNDGKSLKNEVEISERTYELIYNKGCILLGRGQHDAAMKLLAKAESMCRKTLEDEEFSEEEIDAELAIIKAQLGYVYQLAGKDDVALKIYSQVLKNKPTDSSITAVTCNNIVTINKDQNIFDSKKKIKVAVAETNECKLNIQQKVAIIFNNCMLLVQSNQNEACRRQLSSFRSKYPTAEFEAALIEATLLYKEKKLSDAITLLRTVNGKQKSLKSALMLSHLLLMNGQQDEALKVLEDINDNSHRLAIISFLVSLYASNDNKEAACRLLSQAVSWFEKNDAKSPQLVTLYQESSKFYLEAGEPQAAVKMLQELRKREPNNAQVLSQLIAAYSQFDAAKATEMSKQLPPIESVIKSVDINLLESSNWSLGAKYMKKTTKADPSPAVKDTASKKSKKKKRKKHMPKNYDPNVDPDPERWIPRWQRSTFRKKKDRRNLTNQLRGTQGAVGDTDISTKASPKPSTAQPSSQPQASRQQRIQQKKKKKTKR